MVYFAAPKAAIRFGSFEFCSSLLSNPDGSDKYGLGAVSEVDPSHQKRRVHVLCANFIGPASGPRHYLIMFDEAPHVLFC